MSIECEGLGKRIRELREKAGITDNLGDEMAGLLSDCSPSEREFYERVGTHVDVVTDTSDDPEFLNSIKKDEILLYERI